VTPALLRHHRALGNRPGTCLRARRDANLLPGLGAGRPLWQFSCARYHAGVRTPGGRWGQLAPAHLAALSPALAGWPGPTRNGTTTAGASGPVDCVRLHLHARDRRLGGAGPLSRPGAGDDRDAAPVAKAAGSPGQRCAGMATDAASMTLPYPAALHTGPTAVVAPPEPARQPCQTIPGGDKI